MKTKKLIKQRAKCLNCNDTIETVKETTVCKCGKLSICGSHIKSSANYISMSEYLREYNRFDYYD